MRYGSGLLMIALLGISIITGCQSESSITDEDTKYDLPVVDKLATSQRLHIIGNDSMAVSEQYTDVPVVVDLTAYSDRPIERGDVVYFATKKGKSQSAYDIGRVIGLPGEQVVVSDGKISIDGRKLDTFYGLNSDTDQKKDISEYDCMLDLGGNQFFIIGDVWWRNFNGSFVEGPISNDRVKGKVVGWVDKHMGSFSPPLIAEQMKLLAQWSEKSTDKEKLKTIQDGIGIFQLDWNAYDQVSGNKAEDLMKFLYNQRFSIGASGRIQLLQSLKGLDGALSETYSAIVGEWFVSDMFHTVQELALLPPEQVNRAAGYIANHCRYGDMEKAMNDAKELLQADWINSKEKETVQTLIASMESLRGEGSSASAGKESSP